MKIIIKSIVSNIIKNKPTHITSVFKDYLVFDEPIEFLKRKYEIVDIKSRIAKLTEFHNIYFKVFPNYIMIPEKYYMYKNIERKQRAIDELQYCKMVNNHKNDYPELRFSNHSKLFNESYMNHISIFRGKFEKEDHQIEKPDLFSLF